MKRMRLVTSSLLATGFAVVLAGSPLSAGIEPVPFRTGLFGFTDGQAVRIGVYNDRVQKVCPAPESIMASIVLRDVRGAAIFQALTRAIPEGRGMFVDFVQPPPIGDLTGLRLPGLVERRHQVRAEVTIMSVGPDGAPITDGSDEELVPAVRTCKEAVSASLEVVDRASRRTDFTLPFAAVAFNPQPEPPDPTLPGRTSGQ